MLMLMQTTIPLNGAAVTLSLSDLVGPLLVGMILWVIRAAAATKKEIVGLVLGLTTNMAEVKTGLDAHIKQDDERHDGIQRENDGIWRAIGHRKEDHT